MNLFSRKRASADETEPPVTSTAMPDVLPVEQETEDAPPTAQSPVAEDATPAEDEADVVATADSQVTVDLRPTPQPPRTLFAGSFLDGTFEIKEVLARGLFNFYLADAGDYGSHDWKLIGERVAVNEEIQEGPESPFFPPATRFLQDEREYAVWDFENLKSLEDWSAQPNDEIYLHVIGSLARGFAAVEAAHFAPDLPRDGLFFNTSGQLNYFGFFDTASTTGTGMSAVEHLAALSSRFAKTNLAAGATLRLDDEFGALPFTEEVKAFAKALGEGEFVTASDVVVALEALAPASKTEVSLLSDVGMERELNEDCGLIWKSSRAGHSRNFELELLAVADGMGGHEGGEVASDLTLASLEEALSTRLGLNFTNNAVVLNAMTEMLQEVNAAVVGLTENPPYASMRAKPGSTLVCALRVGSRVFIGNVGDSRAYRWNAKSGLQRLTKDHSYVQDLLDSGAITEEQSWGHPDGSVITSHIGMVRGLKRDVFLRLLSAGDRLVLVSDGVVDTLRDAEIEAIIAANTEASQLCMALVNAANDAGGIDNITVATLICR